VSIIRLSGLALRLPTDTPSFATPFEEGPCDSVIVIAKFSPKSPGRRLFVWDVHVYGRPNHVEEKAAMHCAVHRGNEVLLAAGDSGWVLRGRGHRLPSLRRSWLLVMPAMSSVLSSAVPAFPDCVLLRSAVARWVD